MSSQVAPGPARGQALSLNSMTKHRVREVREICVATCGQPLRLTSYLRAWRRRRLVGRTLAHAQLALGRRMYTAGIDDGQCGGQMHSLDDASRGAGSAKPRGRALEAVRARLLLRLAASALAEEGPLPGADAEYGRARDAQAALRTRDAELTTAKALLIPRDKAGWCRVAVGFGTMGLFLVLAVILVWTLP
jgi:hypothetical protein